MKADPEDIAEEVRPGDQPGKRVGGHLYLHKDASSSLPPAHREVLDRAVELAPQFEWNVSKTSDRSASLLLYEDFSKHAFPALLRAATVDIEAGTVKVTDYSSRDNPPILHRKELLLSPGDPRIPGFRAVTAVAEEKGLFADAKTIGTRKAWNELVKRAGLRIDGPRLLSSDFRKADVIRAKTAIQRTTLSAPVAAMIDTGMLEEGRAFFDYGCGLGDDVAALQAAGFSAWGWDPAHRPDGDRRAADIVNLGYVINVIEDPLERVTTLKDAWSFARQGMVVSAMRIGHADVSGQTPHGDGYLTSRATFQRYYAQHELIQFVGDSLGERVTPLGQGIVAVFRDKELEQSVAMRRRSRADVLVRQQAFPRVPRERREAVPRPELVERIEAEIVAIWTAALELGRLPAADEVAAPVLASLSQKRVSFARALQACLSIRDHAVLAELAEARREDLLVETALAMFPGAPRYASLPPAMQKDIRHFFGSHASLTSQASALLASLREPERLEEANAKAVEDGLATLEDGVLRFSEAVSTRLPPPLRIMLGCADIVRPGFSQGDVFEIGPKPSSLRAVTCADMDVPLPRIVSIVDVELGRASAREKNPPDRILYLKSRYLPADDEKREKQALLDRRLLASGVVTPDGKGPDSRSLNAMLNRRS